MKSTKFSIEIYGNEVFDGYTKNEDWNGWACPYFTFEESVKIVDAHRKSGQKAEYNQDSNAFYFEIQDNYEVYKSTELEGIKLYPIGNSNWIWEELE